MRCSTANASSKGYWFICFYGKRLVQQLTMSCVGKLCQDSLDVGSNPKLALIIFVGRHSVRTLGFYQVGNCLRPVSLWAFFLH